jgi:RHS repeat-associated protein
VTNALRQVTRFRYDSSANLTNVIDALDRTNQWFYNTSGLNTSVRYADGLVINKGYDTIGRMNHVTNAATGLILDLGYENLDRLQVLTFRHDGTTMQYSYGCCGLESVSDRLNRTTQFWHDQLGRVNIITDPDNSELSFGYNAANQITSLTNLVSGSTRVKRFEYLSTNGFTRPRQIVTPLQKTITLSNDFRGNLVSRQSTRGETLYQYDLLGQLKRITYPSSSGTVNFGYDVVGNLKACTNTAVSPATSTITWSYDYDALNRVTNAVALVSVNGFSSLSYRIAYAFDAMGNLTNRTVTGLSGFGNVLNSAYQYDMMNRLTNLAARVDGGLLASAAYRYDTAGRLDMKTYGNGDQVGASYDIESRLDWLKWTNNSLQFNKIHYVRDAMGNIKTLETNDQAFRYEYDLKDQLKRERLPDGTVNQWDYDEAGNALVMPGLSGAYYYNADDELDGVSSATTTVTGTVTGGANNHKWYNSWADCRGIRARVSTNNGQFQLPGVPLTYGENILNVTVTDVSGNSSNKSVTVTKGTSGLTKKFYYDAEGNLTTNTASGPWVYEWDYENRLIQAKNNGLVVLKCWYDAYGRRVAKWEIVNGVEKKCLYVWDGWELVAVCNGTGALMESYARGVGLAGDIGTLVAIQFTTGDYTNKLFYTHHNHRGDVILVRDGTSTVAYLDYDPFGRFRNEPTSKVSRFLFSSKELDESTGWYYYGYRYYSPTLQRWPNRDPLGETKAMGSRLNN